MPIGRRRLCSVSTYSWLEGLGINQLCGSSVLIDFFESSDRVQQLGLHLTKAFAQRVVLEIRDKVLNTGKTFFTIMLRYKKPSLLPQDHDVLKLAVPIQG